MRKLSKDKKGDFVSVLYTIVAIFAVGVILLLYNNLFGSTYHEINAQFSVQPQFNNSEAHVALQKIERTENATWDYASLGIAIGYVLVLCISSFLTRINGIFFWIYGILSIFGILVAVMLSNLWQEIIVQPDFAVTRTHFPITDALLGTYYPTFALVLIIIIMILLFGKPSENQQ